VGVSEAQPVAFQQSIESWIEGFHAGNGFSRERMGAARAAAFDGAIRAVMRTYCPTGVVERQIGGRVIYGKPLDPVG